ncbi:MAG: DUF4268 domain-containing protein [Chloroflexota bacterium]|nr:DUF4268 domain-containing protein [Chloroflexota bacterium]
MKSELGTIKSLDPREIWPNEARDFTPWLAEHMQDLSQKLGMDLEVTQTEVPVGEFAVDILAKDLATGGEVVIENQFGVTDHDHFGKLLTYASGRDAFALVWIAQEVRDEHRQALEWLNERTDEGTLIFALGVEVFRIDDSKPAFNLKPVVVPNKWQKSTRRPAANSPRGEAYRAFFQQLIDEMRERHKFTGARVAFPQNWFGFATGVSGITYGAVFAQGGRVRVELYIDRGEAEDNKRIFDSLHAKREEIESRLEAPLEWERLDDRRASRIALYSSGSIDLDQNSLTKIREWMISNLLRFRKVFGPLLRQHSKEFLGD